MANIANDIGMGLMAGYNAYQNASQRAQDYELRRQALARQDQDAQLMRELHGIQRDKLKMEMDQQQQALEMFKPFLQGMGLMGGVPSASQTQAGPSAPSVSPVNLSPDIAGLSDYWSNYHGVDPALTARVIAHESGGNPWAHNKANKNGTDDFGLMQINSGNLGRVAPGENVFNPSENIRIGTSMLSEAMKRSGGDVRGALGMYNTGKVNPNAPYVDKVLGTPAQGTQYAANGGVASDMPAGGAPAPPQQPAINQKNYTMAATMAQMPGPAGNFGKALLAQYDAAIKIGDYMTPQQKADMAFEDAKRLKTWEADQKAKDKAAERTQPWFQGTGMDQQAMNAIQFIGPKIQDGSATDEEKRQYTLAEMHLSTPKVQTDPQTGAQTVIQTDITQFGFPSMRPKPQQQPATQTGQAQAPPGYTMTQTSGPKAMAAGDAGKVKGAELSQQYLDDASRLLFPGGQYDRMAVVKSMLPGTAEADARNKMREAIGYALYLKTGAAATPKEISEQESLYVPGVTDDEKVAKSKMERLKAFLGSVVQAVRPGDAAQKQPQQASESDPLGVR